MKYLLIWASFAVAVLFKIWVECRIILRRKRHLFNGISLKLQVKPYEPSGRRPNKPD